MRTIDERGLADFRRDELSPEAVLAHLQRDVRVLLRLPVGLGKSALVDRVLDAPATFARFDLVLYAAPTWRILRERAILRDDARPREEVAVLEPRPVERCGPFAARWAEYEARGCSALAKATLCRDCRAANPDDPCPWPDQFRRLNGVGVVLATEQHLLLNRNLIPFLKATTGARRVLAVLDEAQVVDRPFEVVVSDEDLRIFGETVRAAARPKGVPSGVAERWVAELDALRDARSEDLPSARFSWSPALNRFAHLLQQIGQERFGRAFRFVGYDLVQLRTSRPEERWKDTAGSVRFVARPWLGVHALMLSAHLHEEYLAHRLGVTHVASPFSALRFRHSGTRVFNLRSRIGADRYFGRNAKQILDAFAVLLARNVAAGRTTILVSRKKSKAACVAGLQERLARWGVDVRFLVDDEPLPEQPDPRIVPVIHYGVVGVNDYAEYEAAYCLNSYYVAERELSAALQEAQPRDARRTLRIVSQPGARRRVVIDGGALGTDLDRLGDLYLRKLEADPAIQAVGRVRFFTKPREIVLFAMHDFALEIPECRDLRSLAALRGAFELPTAAELDAAVETERLRALTDDGYTTEEAAREIGIARSTAFRRFAQDRSLKTPLKVFIRGNGTPGAEL